MGSRREKTLERAKDSLRSSRVSAFIASRKDTWLSIAGAKQEVTAAKTARRLEERQEWKHIQQRTFLGKALGRKGSARTKAYPPTTHAKESVRGPKKEILSMQEKLGRVYVLGNLDNTWPGDGSLPETSANYAAKDKPNADIKSFEQWTSLCSPLYCEKDERTDVGAKGLEAKMRRFATLGPKCCSDIRTRGWCSEISISVVGSRFDRTHGTDSGRRLVECDGSLLCGTDGRGVVDDDGSPRGVVGHGWVKDTWMRPGSRVGETRRFDGSWRRICSIQSLVRSDVDTHQTEMS